MAQLLSASLLVLMAWREAVWSSGSALEFPAWVELGAWALVFFGVGLDLRERGMSGRGVTLAAIVCLIVYCGFARGPELYAEIPPPFVQSQRAELLSTVALGLPLYSMVGLFALFISAAGVLELLPKGAPPGPLSERAWLWVRGGLSTLFFLFGLVALFGYGSGSPSPFSL